ncbi:MAG: PAS domain S-box protein [Tunicatimonas sp.]
MSESSPRPGPGASSPRGGSSQYQEVASASSSATNGLSAAAVLDALYATAPVGLAVLDAQLRYVRINDRLAEINGFPVAQHLGKTVREIVPDLADAAEPGLRRVLETGEPVVDLEIRGETAAQPGVERVWKEQWMPIYDARGEVIGINVMAEEVTEQRQAETALQASQTQYGQLLGALNDGVCVCELLVNENGTPYDYRFLEVNPAFEDHTGLKDAAGKTVYELIPNLEPHWIETYSKVALSNESIRFEQGSAVMGRWFDVYAFPFGLPDSRHFALQFRDISARKQSEEALREREAKFRSFADRAPALLWVTDPIGQCTYLSQAWYDYTGQTERTGLGLGWLEAVHPDDKEASGDIFLKANERQVAFRLEYRLRQRSGDYRWAIDAGTPRFNENGAYLGYVGSVTDIHDRKVAEEVLEQSKKEIERQQQKLQSLFEQAPVAIAIYRGPKHIIELVNPEASEMWGVAVAELMNRPLRETLPEVQKQGMEDLLNGVLRSGEPFVGNEFPVVFDRGEESETRYFDFVYQPWRDKYNAIIGVIAISVDVSHRIAARQEEYKFTTMLDNSSDFIGLATPEGQGIYLNRAGLKLIGLEASYPVSELKVVDFFFEEDLAFVRETILPAVMEKGNWVGECRFRHFQTGRAIPVLYNCFAVREPATNELLGLATTTIDITERKQREAEARHYQERLALTNQELAAINEEMTATNDELSATNADLVHTNEQLERVNADLDNFVYAASHDLKAPISNIKGLLTLLEQGLSPNSLTSPRTQKVLRMMEASVARFMRTIADLSDVARLQRKDQEPEAMVDLEAVIEEVLLDIAPAVAEAQAQIMVEVADCGPVRFTPKSLRSVVYNLLSNAVKYRDPRRPPVVQVRCEAEENYQVLTVADNGLGMDLTEGRQLFGLFQRFHSHVEGTGIGLYMVKKIVENAGGSIHVGSTVGVGTTFIVRFKRW